ncbi:MAG TPA: hypothetical protein VHZ07_14845 [Bryobacteraceae bacterium]|jgi:hypothetical protein|nr:hypothetical protein [Bryobacteraceae bacterium]
MRPVTQSPCIGETQDANSVSFLSLVRGLQSLVDGPAYINKLIAYGPEAVPALADLLLNGKPGGIPQPRQWTVEALGGLGAYDVLLSYLRRPVYIRNPIVRHGEEAVMNTAARQLAAFPAEETFSVLLDLLRRRPLPGVIETIGLYRRKDTAPYLVDALEDDVCRSAAVEALQRLGDDIRPLLVESALIRMPPFPDPESPSSIRRRRCCVRLLESLRLTKEEVSRLAPILNENDADLVVAAAHLFYRTPEFRDYRLILRHLKRVQHTLGWWLQDESRSLILQVEEELANENSDRF